MAAFVLTHRVWLLAVDIVVLGWLGHRIFRAVPQERAAPTGQGVAQAYLSTLSLAIINPMTVLGFTSGLAGLAADSGGPGDQRLAALGIFLGSILWWLTLTGATAALGSRLSFQQMRWINWSSAATIWTFALILLVRLH